GAPAVGGRRRRGERLLAGPAGEDDLPARLQQGGGGRGGVLRRRRPGRDRGPRVDDDVREVRRLSGRKPAGGGRCALGGARAAGGAVGGSGGACREEVGDVGEGTPHGEAAVVAGRRLGPGGAGQVQSGLGLVQTVGAEVPQVEQRAGGGDARRGDGRDAGGGGQDGERQRAR